MKTYKECLQEWNIGNIFYRRKEGNAMMTGSAGGGGGSPYIRVSSGGGKLKGSDATVRYSSGGSRSGKNMIYQTMTQKMGQGYFRRARNVIRTGSPKITQAKLYRTPKFK